VNRVVIERGWTGSWCCIGIRPTGASSPASIGGRSTRWRTPALQPHGRRDDPRHDALGDQPDLRNRRPRRAPFSSCRRCFHSFHNTCLSRLKE
jgi:hypothetical protein